MNDEIYVSRLESMFEEHHAINAESDVVRLTPVPSPQGPPRGYLATYRGVEHLVSAGSSASGRGAIEVDDAPMQFGIDIPPDYLRSVDPTLQFRVVCALTPLFHPNVRNGQFCLGGGFRPGTRLRRLVETIYAIASARVFATDDAFDPEARDHYLAHLDRVESLRAAPLWRRAPAARVRVEANAPAAAAVEVPVDLGAGGPSR